MRSPLICANPSCDVQVGWWLEYRREEGGGGDPPEADVWNEEFVDDEGRVFCSECFEQEEPEAA